MTNRAIIHEGLVDTIVENNECRPTDDIKAVKEDLMRRGYVELMHKRTEFGLMGIWVRRKK